MDDLTSIEEWLLTDGSAFAGRATCTSLPMAGTSAEDSTCWGSIVMNDSTQCVPGFVAGRGHVRESIASNHAALRSRLPVISITLHMLRFPIL